MGGRKVSSQIGYFHTFEIVLMVSTAQGETKMLDVDVHERHILQALIRNHTLIVVCVHGLQFLSLEGTFSLMMSHTSNYLVLFFCLSFHVQCYLYKFAFIILWTFIIQYIRFCQSSEVYTSVIGQFHVSTKYTEINMFLKFGV